MFCKRIVIFIAILVLLFPAIGIAGEVDQNRARIVAQNWLFHLGREYGFADSGFGTPRIVEEEVILYGNQVVGYNFIIFPRGHIIVPFRDELPPVKLYSDTVTLKMADNSDVAEWIKEELFKLYEALNAHQQELENIDLSSTHNGRLWSLFEADSSSFATLYESAASGWEFVSYGPLLQTTWSQGDPYNMYCPQWYTGERTVTGCVATAAAQIMKYYNYPPTGQGTTAYFWYNGQEIKHVGTHFDMSTYNWSLMQNSYSSGNTSAQRDAVARLMSDVGIAFHTDYGLSSAGGSAADTMYGTTVYPTYFKYASTISAVYRSSYASDSAWMQVFRNETYNSRPSQLRIRDPNAGGHSVVVDGYRDSPSEQIHLNMGWSGSYDGWYASNNIVTGSYNWSDVNYQGAVIGIAPSAPSCPSLYFWNGNDYEKRGYIFPGAVDPATKYADNISLNQLLPKRGQYYSLEYSLQIREEEPENSFIDMAMAKLIMVDPGSGVNLELYPTGALKVKSSISAGSISTVEDVTYQVFSSDGQYVSLGMGDMIILTFPYFPQVQGQIRDFIFVVEGFHAPLASAPEHNKEVCSNWARIAVAQNGENLRRACGFTGPQWNSDYNNHFQFCLSVPWEFAISAENAREYDLRNRCRGY